MTPQPPSNKLIWRCRGRALDLGAGPVVMGVLNVTPDSFSDGGRFADASRGLDHARRMVEEGAAIVDVGGESSRPGAEAVSEAEELGRVLPVVERIAQAGLPCLISVDTYKAGVARQALAAGAHIVNDITALRSDPGMAEAVAEHGAGVVLMHMQGTPGTMQARPAYVEVVGDVKAFLDERAAFCVSAGLARDTLAVDPGIGFGKTVEHNLALLAGLPRLAEAGFPVVVGASRKSFIGHLLGRGVDDRQAGSLGAAAYAWLRGAHVIRAHDVKESCDVLRMLAMLRRTESGTCTSSTA
jgi:dihydropteroate synthase